MAVKINFDSTHNAVEPTMVLAKKNGKFLGAIQAHKIRFKDILNAPSEFSFTIYKSDYQNNLALWDSIEDFKIVWVKEWNKCFEIYVETTDEDGIHKSVTAKSLGEAELSQINLYGIEINTENDIARDNYVPTVLYSTENTSSSLLHRISGKIPHYSFSHVDNSIKNIQRTFNFDGKSIYDCFQEIAEEIHCLFDIQCKYESGSLIRIINVYDLETYCPSCGERGSFVTSCSKCGNTVGLIQGYGNDTGIFIDTENLANTITYKTDNESVKNCFKLEAGDDLMTATVISNNPNGSSYIWYIPPKTKQDMSASLVSKLDDYDDLYDYYINSYESTIPQSKITAYNQLVTKYQSYNQSFQSLTYPIVGFSNIIEAEYDTIDLYLFLKSGLMPTVSVASTNATTEIAKLTAVNLSPVAVQNLSVCSAASAENAILSAAKTIVDARYKIDIATSIFASNIWNGTFTLTNYSDDEDTATSSTISITINEDYEKFVKQKIDKVISKTVADGEPTDIVSLFNLSNANFENEIKKYCLTRLQNFHNCCQSCLDVLIQQGVADKTLWNSQVTDLYTTMYLPYYTKLGLLESEMLLRENEIKVIIGEYHSDGRLKTNGLQTLIEKEKTKIQKALNFENYLGQSLWLEFAAFRREDTYKNDNYISDGLNNAELFEKALQFIDTAKKDIIKSATLQHTITATLKNLLVMPEFSPLLNQFEVGNWLRAKIDGDIYKFRLLDYEIDFDDLNSLSVTFSDVVYNQDEVSDIESIISQAKSISTSYGNVTRQMEQGEKTTSIVDGWVENGLNVTNTKIICQADNQTYTSDEHGMLFRKYDSVNNSYDDTQLKITNSTLAITNDNWETVKNAVGNYYYFDPITNKLKMDYGVIADTIIGKLILGEQLGIYNSAGSLTFNHNGFNITNTKNTFNVNPNTTNLLTISKTVNNTTDNIFYVDENGTLHVKGDGSALDITANSSITGATSRIAQTENDITAIVSRDGNGTIISLDSNKVKIAWNNISQYIQFDTVSNRAGLSIYNSSSNRVLRLDNAGLNINNSTGNDLMKLNTTGLKLYGQYNNDNNTYLLMSLDSQGQSYYYKQDSSNNPIMVGKIGSSSWSDDDTFRGLRMGLRYGGSYLAWSYQDTENGNYNIKIVYFATDSDKGNEGVHLKDTTYLDYTTYCGSNLWLNENVRTIRYNSGDAGIYSSTHGVSLEGTTALIKGTDGSFKIENGAFNLYNSTDRLVNCYNNLDMHNFAINNATINSSSDARMKTNIEDTDVNAVDILNQIEMKTFDWRTDNKHEDIGIIAQQLQEVLPDLVYEDELTTKLSIQPIKFIPYLIKAIQELSAKIDGDKKPKTKNKSNNKKYSFSKKEIDGFLKRITPKSVPNHRQVQEEEEIKFTPIYIENQFKSKERKDKKK